MSTSGKAAPDSAPPYEPNFYASAAKLPLCIYIVGYGRSGSTLLDTILGNHERIYGAGELSYLFEELQAHGRCSCGMQISACDHWRSVLQLVEQKYPRGQKDHRAWGRLSRKLEHFHLVPLKKELGEHYSELWREMFKALADVSGKNIIIDSSKSTRKTWNRPVLLRQACLLDVKVIHLVRDPRAVLWSVKRGSNRLLEADRPAHRFGGTTRGLLGWLFANLTAEYIKRRLPPEDTLLLQYEALVSDPAAQLEKVSKFIGLPPNKLAMTETLQTLETGHGTSGNRMRRQGAFQIRLDDEWKHTLTGPAYLLGMLAWPLARKYGYPIKYPKAMLSEH